MALGDKILSELKKRKISVTSFSKTLELSRGTFYNYIGSAEPDNDFIKKIEKYLNIDLSNDYTSVQKLEEPDIEYRKVNKGVPYYDIDVTAGNMEIFKGDNVDRATDFFYIPGFNDCTACVNVRGDSMYSKYCAGDIIAIKLIEDRDVIQYGEAYVITTKDQNLFKYIRRHHDEDKWMLESENKERYDAFSIQKRKVLNIFLVRGVVRAKTM